MKVQLAQWGNSAAFRVPAFALEDLGMRVGQTLEMHMEGRRLVIEPASESLEDLVNRITPENRHALVFEDDESRGGEVW